MKTAKIAVFEGKEAGMRNPTGWNSQVSRTEKRGGKRCQESIGRRTEQIQAACVCSVDLVLYHFSPTFNFGGFNSKISVFNVDSIYLLTTPKKYTKGNMNYSELIEKHSAKQNCGCKGL